MKIFVFWSFSGLCTCCPTSRVESSISSKCKNSQHIMVRSRAKCMSAEERLRRESHTPHSKAPSGSMWEIQGEANFWGK